MKQVFPAPFASKSNSGYTLIEVMIAVGIFSIGLMAMGALQSASLMGTGNVERRTEAWAILDDQAETLKAMPFYANDNGVDDDGDGTVDELTEEMPELVAGNYNAPRINGRYIVNWQVVDDVPIGQQTAAVLPEVPVGNYTVSKTISVQVTRPGDNPQTDPLAMVQFVKTWAADGIP
ncbi:MAG: prepilin-type N-terminal cleavage/methylation domain-containing protein [Desulfobacteraceae bacterium]|nr:MAG: prepilin-type N-terminal cleavage/methylation domain-containing protein [Desulfobacteraceae bacterium]